MSETHSIVHLDVHDGAATITLDSPENRNALSAQLVGELSAHLTTAASDPTARFVVLTHTSNTFCAGADLAESAREGGPAEGTARLVALLRQIVEHPKPVVARVDGHVRAGGLGLLAACAIAVVGRSSSFAFTEARIGVAPAIISLTVLPRIGDRAASLTFLTGDRFDAGEAARIGLVTRAVDDPSDAIAELAESFRACSPQGLTETKRLTTRHLLDAFDRDAHDLAALSGRLFASDEAQEGIASFLARRPPRWAG